MLHFLGPRLLLLCQQRSRLVEPFVGGGAFFFFLKPKKALLSDINPELIDLYKGIKRYPIEVWRKFSQLPTSKRGYYEVRAWRRADLDLVTNAARTLYLNRTCFKGMWRHNRKGDFNVGYGGQDRRWVLDEGFLLQVSKTLRNATLICSDFEEVIEVCGKGDFLFLDPPYRPGEMEMTHDHYAFGKFTFDDHTRLAMALRKATARGVRWALTTSSHERILSLFDGFKIEKIPRGTGTGIGLSVRRSREVLICG
jgi:DNA adenine methylase